MKKIIIYTDGACSGNPGPGGWGAVLILEESGKNKAQKNLSGKEPATTNNKMELRAVIEALKAIKDKEYELEIYTDSNYVKDGTEKWIHSWKKNGWKTSAKAEVKNKDLWIELDNLVQQFKIKWHWVKGHSGNKYNELADSLARGEA
jgi:ribonuclease HI